MEVRIHLVDGLAISVHSRSRRPVNPFIPRMKLRAETWHLGGNACGKRVPRNRLQHVAQQAVRIICRSQSAREGIERGKFSIVFELPSKRHARAPVARGAAVISKALGEVILKVVRGG